MKLSMDNDREIERLYNEFKEEFLRNTARYDLDMEQRIDIYQDAFVALYETVKYKKNEIVSGYKNYLFGIGRNMIRDRIRLEIKERQLKEVLMEARDKVDMSFYEIDDMSPMQLRLQNAVKELSESCRKILVLFYFRQYSIEAIMHSMNHRNENVTKSHKSRCIKGLKEKIKQSKKMRS